MWLTNGTRVPCKRLGRSIEFIEKLIASDPERAIAILEEGPNVDPAEAIGISWFVNEQFEVVAYRINLVQPILRVPNHMNPDRPARSGITFVCDNPSSVESRVKRIPFPSTTGRVIVRGSSCACCTTPRVSWPITGRPAPSRAIPNVVAHKSATRAQRTAKRTRTAGSIVPW